eukprot:TRINITY_DN20866_c0_g1_i1.p1 TRINITY_DN20866_c0_g1~~TRINITY_DN20866_c0_g1_i1.p1  ORF type:complete len:325 (-),score=83.54 TRINITY_DN20866_c0_g1_i1:649-1623(-)
MSPENLYALAWGGMANEVKGQEAADLSLEEEAVLVSKSDAMPDSQGDITTARVNMKSSEEASGSGRKRTEVASGGDYVLAEAEEEEVWIAEDAWKSAGQAAENFKGLSKGVVNLASNAGKEAAAAVQELTDKMKVPMDLTLIGSKFSSWWTNLDSPLATNTETAAALEESPPPADENGPSSKGSTGDSDLLSAAHRSANLQALFGLSPDEEVIEAFPCKVIQTYKCTHNQFTPEIQMAFRGTLFITDTYICFYVNEGNRKIPIKLEQGKVESVLKQVPRRGENEGLIKLSFDSDSWFAVKDFASGEDQERAYALLEHMCEAARS